MAEDCIAALKCPVKTSPAKPLRPPCQGVDQRLHPSNVYASETCSFAVSTDGVHFVTKHRVRQNKMHDGEDDHRSDDRDRYAEQTDANSDKPPCSARRRNDAVGFVVVHCSMVIDKAECVTMFDDVSDTQQRLSLK
jgi:hypothetical protein